MNQYLLVRHNTDATAKYAENEKRFTVTVEIKGQFDLTNYKFVKQTGIFEEWIHNDYANLVPPDGC